MIKIKKIIETWKSLPWATKKDTGSAVLWAVLGGFVWISAGNNGDDDLAPLAMINILFVVILFVGSAIIQARKSRK